MISWRKKNEKYIINKDGVYFSLSEEQLKELYSVLLDIALGENKYYKEDSRK